MAEYVKWKGEDEAPCDLAQIREDRKWFKVEKKKKERNILKK